MRAPALLLLLSLPPAVLATAFGSSGERVEEGKRRFELHCGVCHSLQLPRAQHLDRQNWKWVIDDMVDELGATWLTEEDRQLILEYLVSEHGPRE